MGAFRFCLLAHWGSAPLLLLPREFVLFVLDQNMAKSDANGSKSKRQRKQTAADARRRNGDRGARH